MEIDNKICERCGHKLLVGAIEEMGEGTETRLFCPHCGIVIEVYEDDTCLSGYNVKDVGKIDNPCEHYCTNCGYKIRIDSNSVLSDSIDTISYDGDDEKICLIFHTCENCGMSEERWDNSENEKCLFPYWEQDFPDYFTAIKKMKFYADTMNITITPEDLPVVKKVIQDECIRCKHDFDYFIKTYCKYEQKINK